MKLQNEKSPHYVEQKYLIWCSASDPNSETQRVDASTESQPPVSYEDFEKQYFVSVVSTGEATLGAGAHPDETDHSQCCHE